MIVVAVLYGLRQLADSVDLATFLAIWGAAVLVEIGMAFTRRARTVFCEGEASGVLRPAWLTSGSSRELHSQGIPAPHTQPSSSCHALSGDFRRLNQSQSR